MPTYIEPSGSNSGAAVDGIAPKTAATPIEISTAKSAGTVYGRLNGTNSSIEINTINEYTAANGVVIDSFKIKDGGARLTNNTYFKALTSIATEYDLFKLNASDLLEFSTSAIYETAWVPTYGTSGGGTFTSVTTDYAYYVKFGRLVFCWIEAHGTVGGSPTILTFTMPFTHQTQVDYTYIPFSAQKSGSPIDIALLQLTSNSTTARVSFYGGGAFANGASTYILGTFSYVTD